MGQRRSPGSASGTSGNSPPSRAGLKQNQALKRTSGSQRRFCSLRTHCSCCRRRPRRLRPPTRRRGQRNRRSTAAPSPETREQRRQRHQRRITAEDQRSACLSLVFGERQSEVSVQESVLLQEHHAVLVRQALRAGEEAAGRPATPEPEDSDSTRSPTDTGSTETEQKAFQILV